MKVQKNKFDWEYAKCQTAELQFPKRGEIPIPKSLPKSYKQVEFNLPKEGSSFIVPSLLAREEEEKLKIIQEKDEQDDSLSDSTFHVENVKNFKKSKKPNFRNYCFQKDDKVIQIQRYLFGTDLWFTGLGMSIHQL
mmetsp:Transcript_6987/g.6168  ORF Transcript_6987/g.6168 Transcript_6987/m.6168 type:complete len:136 (+) Transcript_6987:353-760(+)